MPTLLQCRCVKLADHICLFCPFYYRKETVIVMLAFFYTGKHMDALLFIVDCFHCSELHSFMQLIREKIYQ